MHVRCFHDTVWCFALFLHAQLLIYEYEWRLDRTWFHCRLKAFYVVFFAFSYAIPQAICSASFDNAFQLSCSHAGTTIQLTWVVPYVLIVAICAAVFHPPHGIAFLLFFIPFLWRLSVCTFCRIARSAFGVLSSSLPQLHFIILPLPTKAYHFRFEMTMTLICVGWSHARCRQLRQLDGCVLCLFACFCFSLYILIVVLVRWYLILSTMG